MPFFTPRYSFSGKTYSALAGKGYLFNIYDALLQEKVVN